MKRILSVTLAIIVALSVVLVVPVGVTAHATENDNLYFKLNSDGNSYYIYDCATAAAGEIIIPETYNDLPVTAVGANAFYNCKSITSVVIPEGVTSIGKAAFKACTALTAIDIPSTVAEVGSEAFYQSSKLKRINISDIDSWCGIAFANYDSNPLYYSGSLYVDGECVNELVIPESVTSIGGYAFYNLVGMTSVELPESLEALGKYAFRGCKGLTSVDVPDSTTEIGNYAFGYCSNLSEVTLPDEGIEVGVNVFVSTPIIDDQNNWVDGALYVDDYLITVEKTAVGDYRIKDDTVSLADGSMAGCSSITGVGIPKEVNSIGGNAFKNCSSLDYIFYGGTEEEWENVSKDASKFTGYDIHFGALSHEGEWEIIAEPTCTQAGARIKHCDHCGIVIAEEEIPALGHTASDYIIDENATCTENGTCHIECTVCGEIISIEDVLATFHNPSDWIIDSEATCTESGSRHIECTECGDVLETEEILPEGHTESGWITDKNANCTENGLRHTECTVCGETIETKEIPAKGHTESGWIPGVSATCTENGTRYKRCTVCEVTLKTEEVPATGHVASEWLMVSDADCTANGALHIECTVCGDVLETEEIPAKGHTASDWIIDRNATCSENGSRHTECTVCGEVLTTAVILPTGHIESEWIIDLSTDTKIEKHTECTVCGKVINTYEETLKIEKCKAPTLKAIENVSDGVKITWAEDENADYYRVYRKSTKGGWKAIGDTEASYYVDSDVKSGSMYSYTVKAVNAGGISAHNVIGLKIKYLAQPEIKSAEQKHHKTKLHWSKVSGATEYIVYKLNSDGEWTVIGKTKKTDFEDKKARLGEENVYSVRACNKQYKSSMNEEGFATGKTITAEIKGIRYSRHGAEILWRKVAGANGYIIYRVDRNGEKKEIANVNRNKTSYKDNKAKNNRYDYVVVAY